MINLFEIIGIIGLIILIFGILSRDKRKEHASFAVGGLFLATYSYYLGSMIFLILQIVIILASVYELSKYDLKK